MQGSALVEKPSQRKLLVQSLQYGCVRRSQITCLQPLPEPRRKIHGTCLVMTYYSPEKRTTCKVCDYISQLNFNAIISFSKIITYREPS